MRRGKTRILGLAGATALFLGACGESFTEAGGPRNGRMELDLRPLFGTTASGQRVVPGTVIDSLGLTVTPEGAAAPLTFGRKLVRGDSVVSLLVTVPEGRARFSANVVSTNGTVLLAGDTSTTVRQDGFRVELQLQPRAPILVVTPDSLLMRPGTTDATVRIANRGRDVLVWQITGITPSPGTCRPDCIAFRPTSGRIPAGESAPLGVSVPSGTPPQTFTTILTSPEGHVEFRVRVTP